MLSVKKDTSQDNIMKDEINGRDNSSSSHNGDEKEYNSSKSKTDNGPNKVELMQREVVKLPATSSEPDNESSIIKPKSSKKKKQSKTSSGEFNPETEAEKTTQSISEPINSKKEKKKKRASKNSEKMVETGTNNGSLDFEPSESEVDATEATLEDEDTNESALDSTSSPTNQQKKKRATVGEDRTWLEDDSEKISETPTARLDPTGGDGANTEEGEGDPVGGKKSKKKRREKHAKESDAGTLENSNSLPQEKESESLTPPNINEDEHPSDRKQRRSSRKRKSERKPVVDVSDQKQILGSISLPGILDDVVQTRTTWQGSGEEASSVQPTVAQRLVQYLEKMLDRFVKLSDALELIVKTNEDNDSDQDKTSGADDARAALTSITTNYIPLLNNLWEEQLKPSIALLWGQDIREDHVDLLYRTAIVLKILTAQIKEQFFVRCDPPIYLECHFETKMLVATLFEFLRRDGWALSTACNTTGTNGVNPEVAPMYQPSALLQFAWGVELHSDEWLEVNRKAHNAQAFRRTCFCFLFSRMSSTSVIGPKSMELLLEYCEYQGMPQHLASQKIQTIESDDAREQIQRAAAIPTAAKLVLEKIRGTPLPRQRLVDQVLQRILPGEPSGSSYGGFLTNLHGPAAIGKSTVVAMVVHLPNVRTFYVDGICWVRPSSAGELNYSRYIMCLHDLLQQLGDDINIIPREIVRVPGETETARRSRELDAMTRAKQQMIRHLKYKKVLMVLDDVEAEDDSSWFVLHSKEATGPMTLMTTRSGCSVAADAHRHTVEVGPIGQEDAIRLFHQECARTTHLLGKALELPARSVFESETAKRVIRNCSSHPVVLALMGRFIALCSQQDGSELTSCLESTERLLAEITLEGEDEKVVSAVEICLSLTSDGLPTRIIGLCVVAFVEVFCGQRQLQRCVGGTPFPAVPIEIVDLLFESVLVFDEKTFENEVAVLYKNKKRAAELLRVILGALGILTETTDLQTTHLSHKVIREYVKTQTDKDPAVKQFVTKGSWHRAFATNLMDSAKDWANSADDTRLIYVATSLPFHMISGGMLVEAGDMIASRRFAKRRGECLGLVEAAQSQIADVEHLLERLVPAGPCETSMPYYKLTIRQSYQATVDAMKKLESANNLEHEAAEISTILVDIGSSFAAWFCFDDAVVCWHTSLLRSWISLTTRISVLFNIGASHTEMREYDEAVATLRSCLRMQQVHYGSNHIASAVTLQAIGNAFYSSCDYCQALDTYKNALVVLVGKGHLKSAHLTIAEIESKLGTIYFKRQEFSLSVDHYMDALRSMRLYCGKTNPKLAVIYECLGTCLLEKGDLPEAIEAFERALALRESQKDGKVGDNPDVLTTKGLLAQAKRKISESMELLGKALEAFSSSSAQPKQIDRQKLVALQHTLGKLYIDEGEEKRAMKLLQACKAEASEALGDSHVDVAAALFSIAKVLERQGRLSEAATSLEEAWRIQTICIPDSDAAAATSKQLAFCKQRKGRFAVFVGPSSVEA